MDHKQIKVISNQCIVCKKFFESHFELEEHIKFDHLQNIKYLEQKRIKVRNKIELAKITGIYRNGKLYLIWDEKNFKWNRFYYNSDR